MESTGPVKKDTNPKDSIGAGKLSMHLIPRTALAYLALAFTEGALKYGKFNWRKSGVRMSIYLDAIDRHLAKLSDGEWADGWLDEDTPPETRGTMVPHLASIMASCAIILDAYHQGKLVDDRAPRGRDTTELIDGMVPFIKRMQDLFQDYTPHQHTIMDEKEEG